MSIIEFFRRPPKYRYTMEEIEALENYIQEQFGPIESVFHEKKSPDIHLDIYLFKPTPEDPFMKLVTVGVGAYTMNVPQEYKGLGMDRAELVITLPENWNVKNFDERNYWPIRLLKQVGRLPILCETWIGEGHTISSETPEPFADSTKLNSCLLIDAQNNDFQQMSVLLPSGKKIRFYNILPLYQEELDYKQKYGSAALVEELSHAGVGLVIDPERVNVCK